MYFLSNITVHRENNEKVQNINNIYTSYMQFIYENIHICLIVLFSLCSFVWDALIRLIEFSNVLSYGIVFL